MKLPPKVLRFGIATICGVLCGVAYFYIMDSSIPEMMRNNCSYTSGVVTDILAFCVGVLLMWRGFANEDYVVFVAGTAIIIEHIIQLIPKVKKDAQKSSGGEEGSSDD